MTPETADADVPYVERLRRSAIRPGVCEFCGHMEQVPEFHHESYRPERGILLCHFDHHRAHFRPYQLTRQEKEKLLFYRHGFEEFNRRRSNPTAWADELARYVAPGRRDAQLELRTQLRNREIINTPPRPGARQGAS